MYHFQVFSYEGTLHLDAELAMLASRSSFPVISFLVGGGGLVFLSLFSLVGGRCSFIINNVFWCVQALDLEAVPMLVTSGEGWRRILACFDCSTLVDERPTNGSSDGDSEGVLVCRIAFCNFLFFRVVSVSSWGCPLLHL